MYYRVVCIFLSRGRIQSEFSIQLLQGILLILNDLHDIIIVIIQHNRVII